MEEKIQIIENTLALIRIDSRNNPHGEDIITGFISKFLEDIKIDYTIIDHENFRKSLIAHVQGESSEKNITLCGHLDTINISSALPNKGGEMDASIVEDKIFGIGSSDMKSGLTCILFALKYLKENGIKPKYDIYIVFTGDEEADKTGALFLLTQPFLKNTKLLLIAEPTNLNLGLGEKGQIWFEVRFKGKAAHGSVPDKGKNAILMAMNFIEKLLYDDFFEKNNSFFPKSSVNIGYLNAPGPFNVVQDSCIAGIDIRLSPPETILAVTKKINKLLSQNFKKTEYEIKYIDSLDPTFVHPESKTAKHIKKIIDKHISGRRKIALPYATDGSVINHKISLPVVILGPGNPDVIHNKDEYVLTENILKSVEIYRDILCNLSDVI